MPSVGAGVGAGVAVLSVAGAPGGTVTPAGGAALGAAAGGLLAPGGWDEESGVALSFPGGGGGGIGGSLPGGIPGRSGGMSLGLVWNIGFC